MARIYNPDSENPLLETSFEQLARSASRICLHSLVLLEQLPLDVKSYNIRQIHDYIRKAILSYGAYKQVAPWIKRLSRGAYAGRLVAGASPVSLGAWWLATELGRRGAAKVVENVVDRQAVGALNDLISIVGTEAGNIYAPGYRQRDSGWVYGTELTELLHRFPVSRENLQLGLREITELKLRSEYDRIYLYRCIADRRSAGLRIVDPTILSRPDREQIARQLEQFFANAIHGVTNSDRVEWKNDVEQRLDLKLTLGQPTESSTNGAGAEVVVRAVHAFLTSIAAAEPSQAVRFLEQCSLITGVAIEQRSSLLAELSTKTDAAFEPPDIDPGSEMAGSFLKSLVAGNVFCGPMDENVEKLLIETCCFYRRSHADATTLIDDAYRGHLRHRCTENVSLKSVPLSASETDC